LGYGNEIRHDSGRLDSIVLPCVTHALLFADVCASCCVLSIIQVQQSVGASRRMKTLSYTQDILMRSGVVKVSGGVPSDD
jgi:hypothetical protein